MLQQSAISNTDLNISETLPHEVLLSVLEEPDLGLIVLDPELRLCHATENFWGLLKAPRESLRDVSDVLSKSILKTAAVTESLNILRSVQSDISRHETAILATTSPEQSFQLRTRRISDRYVAASFRGVHLREARGADHCDPLTGIPNRLCFEAVAREALKNGASQVAVILVDLDRFKAVNDTLGHAIGDALLKLVGERLRSVVRAGDMIARFGGDEFALFIDPAPTREEPARVAKRILDLVQRTYMIEGHLVNVGVSAGISISPSDGTDCKSLLRSADLALYQAKASGRATFEFFDPSMEDRARRRRANEQELRKALALRQLELFYQPQVDAPYGRLVGFEALIRWRHPEKGLIAPSEFMPLAEELGIIVPIGEWVLRTACREAMKWPPEITVAVNASPVQFDAGNFAQSVRQALKVTGLPGERLEIEITEGILLRNDESVMNTLHEIRGMKVRIAMDDFGTGYASLSQLARFPFDKIKIDRSLVGFEGDDLKQRAIVRAITALGQSLGICTLAEGVESVDQLARLHSDGCQSIQGFLMGRPVPADKLNEIILRLGPLIQGDLK